MKQAEITPDRIKSLSNSLKMEIDNLTCYSDGFSFTVKTELQAYKAAYKYQGRRVVVKFAPNVNLWSVQVYQK